MELWLLGGGAVVLIAITLWIVWPAETVEPLYQQEDLRMTPQGDEFEDQYTSATADLSAGGVATAVDAMQEEAALEGASEPAPNVEPTVYAAAGEPWSSPTMAREGATDVAVTAAPAAAASEPGAGSQTGPAASASGSWSVPESARSLAQPRTIGLGAAVVLAIASAIVGAWLYARWQRRRNEPINRARRTMRHAQKELTSGLRERQKGLRSSRFPGGVRL